MRVPRRVSGQWRCRAVVAALALAATVPAWPCGFEDPNSVAVQRGAMNLAFPQALHVLGAISQAQMAGDLPRDRLAEREDVPAPMRGTLQRLRAGRLLVELAERLGAARDEARHPDVAIVLLGPMMWSRMTQQAGRAVPQVHVSGPERGDVVIVTDTLAVEAIVEAGMSFAQATELGLMRLYGPPERIDALQTWLASS